MANTHNSRLFIANTIFTLLIVQLWWAVPTYAAQSIVRMNLDAATVARGFTIESADAKFRVGITPKALNKRAQVSVRIKQLPTQMLPLENETLLSNVYSFDIYNKKTVEVKKPIWISIQQTISTNEDVVLKYWSNDEDAWIELPSTIQQNEQRVQAAIHVPYAVVALFEKERITIEGTASWYDWYGAAMNDVPLGTDVMVTNPENNEQVTTTVVSTGPYVSGRIIDLPRDIFAALAPIGRGVISVIVTPLL